jgi:Lon protease-like protein
MWPLRVDATVGPGVVPMFPLRGVFLFPGQILPLHIFEPRYRRMIEDLLDGPGRLVMGTIRESQEGDDSGAPAVLPVAGLGEIARHERLPDGRFTVLLVGLTRVLVEEEVESGRPYRLVSCRPLRESPPDSDADGALQHRLLEAIRARTGFSIDESDEVSTAQLADILAQTLSVPQSLMEEIFAECEIELRAEKVLAAYEGFGGA